MKILKPYSEEIRRNQNESSETSKKMITEVKRVVSTSSDNKYLSLRQSMARFDVSRSTLFRWHKEFGLPVSHVRGRVFYRIADIQEIIEKHFSNPPRSN
jgi:predicted DNA-binding transcriptional regulator AlpA